MISPFTCVPARDIAEECFGWQALSADLASPFIRAKQLGCFSTLELIGRQYADYRSIEQVQDLDTLWDIHQQQYNHSIIELGCVAERDAHRSAIEAWLQNHPMLVREVALPRAPYLALKGTWDDYRRSKRKKFWYNISRAERLLAEKSGPVTFRIVDQPEEMTPLLERCMVLYAENWHALNSGSIYLSETGGEFLRKVIAAYGQRGQVEISVVEQGDTLLSFAVGIKQESTYFFYLFGTSRDVQYRQYSLGKILLRHLLEHVYTNGFTTFDFMAGEEPYKYEWTKTSQGRSSFYCMHKSIVNRAILGQFMASRRMLAWAKGNTALRKVLDTVGQRFLS